MTYTIKYNRTTNHIDGVVARNRGEGRELGGVIGYYAQNACGAITRGRFAEGKSFESLADTIEAARKAGGRKLCKTCEKAATALLTALTAPGPQMVDLSARLAELFPVGPCPANFRYMAANANTASARAYWARKVARYAA